MKFDEHPFGNHLPSLHELTDASNECRHGRLPFDKGPRCGCWHISWSPGVTPAKRKPRYRKHPPLVRRTAVEQYRGGMSIRQIAVRCGASRATVRDWLLEAGVEVHSRRAA